MVFVADLGLNLAPKFIEEADGGVGGQIPARGWWNQVGHAWFFWVDLAVRRWGWRVVAVDGRWSVVGGRWSPSVTDDAGGMAMTPDGGLWLPAKEGEWW